MIYYWRRRKGPLRHSAHVVGSKPDEFLFIVYATLLLGLGLTQTYTRARNAYLTLNTEMIHVTRRYCLILKRTHQRATFVITSNPPVF